MNMRQRTGWTNTESPTIKEFFFSRKAAQADLLEKLTVNPNLKVVLKPAILNGTVFTGKVQKRKF